MPSSLLPTLTLNLKTDALIHGAKKILIKMSVDPLVFLAVVLHSLLHSYLLLVLRSTCHLLDFGSRVLPKDEEMLSILLLLLAILFRHRSTNWGPGPRTVLQISLIAGTLCSFSPSPTFGKYAGIFNFMMLKTSSSFQMDILFLL